MWQRDFEAHEGRGDATGMNAVHESLKRFQSSKNQNAEAAAMDMLLRGHCEKGEFQEALAVAEKARSAFQALGDEAAEANVSALAAGLQLKLRDPDEALRLGHLVVFLHISSYFIGFYEMKVKEIDGVH